MSNSFPITYPRFQPAQTLRSTNLNQILEFLAGQDRATRQALGFGILCGLEPEIITDNSTTKLKISSGIGISSNGHMFVCRNGNNTFKLEYEFYRDATADTVEQTSLVNTFCPSIESPSDLTLVEFRSDDSSDHDHLADLPDLADRVIVLYYEEVESNGKICFGNFNGEVNSRTINIRAFGIHKGIFDKCIQLPQPLSNFPFITRLQLKPEPGESPPLDYDFNWLMSSWKKVIDDALGTIATELVEVLSDPIASPPDNLVGDWQESINDWLTSMFATDPPDVESNVVNIQYLNDHLRDVICAYNELAELIVQDSYAACIDDSRFDDFIALGTPDVHISRMPFYRSGSTENDQYNFYKKRLRLLLEYQFVDKLIKGDVDSMRISGSRTFSAPLGDRAVPFYYKKRQVIHNELINYWNFDLTRANRQSIIQYYEDYNGTYPRQALKVDVAKYNFFRIEGHLGQKLKDGYNKIEELRHTLNVPFEITCVQLGGEINKDSLPDFISLPDASHPEYDLIVDQLTFDGFYAHHPGLEHLGGVPEGGTFVIVYVDTEQPAGSKRDGQIEDTIPNQNVNVFMDQSGKKLIVGDFCLPYSRFNVPMVRYNFFEVGPPIADFECESITYVLLDDLPESIQTAFDGMKGPFAEVKLGDRSGKAVTYEWSILPDSSPGIAWENGLNTPDLTLYVAISTVQTIEATLEVSLGEEFGAPDTASKTIKLCPTEMTLSAWSKDPRQFEAITKVEYEQVVLGEEVLISSTEVTQFYIIYRPHGGEFAISDAINDLVEIVNDTSYDKYPDARVARVTVTPNGSVPDPIPPGQYSIWYRYPGCNLEREIRLIVRDPSIIDFECESTEHLVAENDDPFKTGTPYVKVTLSNRSLRGDEADWDYEAPEGSYIEELNNPENKQIVYFNLKMASQVTVTLTLSKGTPEELTASKEIDLCPSEVKFGFVDLDDDGNTINVRDELHVAASADNIEFNLGLNPAGGVIKPDPELKDKLTFGTTEPTSADPINVYLTSPDKPLLSGRYPIRYEYPDNTLEGTCSLSREIYLVVSDPGEMLLVDVGVTVIEHDVGEIAEGSGEAPHAKVTLANWSNKSGEESWVFHDVNNNALTSGVEYLIDEKSEEVGDEKSDDVADEKGDEAGLTIVRFDLNVVQRVIAELTVTTDAGESGTARASVDLCPVDMSVVFEIEDVGSPDLSVEGITVGEEIIIDDANMPFSIVYTPPGGTFSTHAALEGLIEPLGPAKEGRLDLSLSDLDELPAPGTYPIWYKYPTGCSLEREVRIIIPESEAEDSPPFSIPEGPSITPPGGPGNVVTFSRSAGASLGREALQGPEELVSPPRQGILNKRRTRYNTETNSVGKGDSKFERTTAFKKTKSFLMLAPNAKDVAEVAAQYSDLSKSLLRNINKKDTPKANKKKYEALLQQSTWFYLDKMIAEHPGAVPDTVKGAVKETVSAMKKAKVSVTALRKGWDAPGLEHPLTKKYMTLLK